MSKKTKAPDIQVRSGVLSCFNYKKKTLLQKEAYELSPMYWKCFCHGRSGNVIMQGHRSEVSHKNKPQVNMTVNGCTTELLPPILKAKGKDYPGNDNYLGIQSADDKIVFLKAEGRSQRDLWYKDIIEALGERASTTSNPMAAAPERRSASQERPPMPTIDDKMDNDNHSLGGKAPSQSDVYHVPYQDYEPMRCSVSTEDDVSSSTGTKPPSSSPIISDVGEEEAFSADQSDVDDDGYVFPTPLAKKTIDLHAEGVDDAPSTGSSCPSPKTTPLSPPRLPEAKPPLPAAVDDRPAISSDFLESLKQARESKSRPFDSSPDKPRYTAVSRRTKPQLPENPPKIPLALPPMPINKELKPPNMETRTPTEENASPVKSNPLKIHLALPPMPNKELKPPNLETKSHTEENVSPAKSNPPKIPLALPPTPNKELKPPNLETKSHTEENVSPAKSSVKSVKTPQQETTRKSARKPMKMPPPLPAGGNSKPKALLGSSERQDSLPQLPPIPQHRGRLTPGETSLSSSETSPVKQLGSDANEKVYQLVRSFRSTQMSPDAKAVQIAKETLQEKDSLKLSCVKNMVYISAFRDELSNSELLVGDEVHMINSQTVASVEEATKCIQVTEGESLTFSIKKIPHGVLSFISRSQEPSIDLKKLGLTLRGNEVTRFDSEGLVVRSGIPSRQLVPGITNNGEMVNWALTQINMIPISGSVTTAQVEQLLSESGNTVALIFHPADFAAALA